MRVVVTIARTVGTVVVALLVPVAVLLLLDAGVAGSWAWFPACLALVAGVAGCAAAALWWTRRRMRVVAGLAVMAWGIVAVGAAYSPLVATQAAIRAAYDRVEYDGALFDPYVWDLGPTWCGAGMTSVLGCPHLSVDYVVPAGDGEDVVQALQDAGFELLGEAGPRPVDDLDLLGTDSSSMGTRYWLRGEGMRLEVTLIGDGVVTQPLDGVDTSTSVPTGIETVRVDITDARHSRQLEIPDDLGLWDPSASLEDLAPPPGW